MDAADSATDRPSAQFVTAPFVNEGWRVRSRFWLPSRRMQSSGFQVNFLNTNTDLIALAPSA